MVRWRPTAVRTKLNALLAGRSLLPAPKEEQGAQVGQTICRLLVQQGELTTIDSERALRLASATDESACSVLVKLGFVSEASVLNAASSLFNVPVVTEPNLDEAMEARHLVTKRFLRDRHAFVASCTEAEVVVAVSDPEDEFTRRAIEVALGRPATVALVGQGLVNAVLDQLYPDEEANSEGQRSEVFGASSADDDVIRLRDLASEAPTIRYVTRLFEEAVKRSASDIHFEPDRQGVRVRLRVDGALHDFERIARDRQAAVLSRIKILANLDIAEHRLPQDGRIDTAVAGQRVDLRVAIIPTAFGESAVIRVLNRNRVRLDFASLGFSEEPLRRFLDLLAKPHGIVLLTGPTGSGKTTTLYAGIKHLQPNRGKIITVEDPIEYELEGISQVNVRTSIGLGFSAVLRSALRHDPDVLMVGEIRDRETAEIAIQAALTGHLVLSTLHTNSAVGSVMRLRDMGVEPYLISAALAGVAAQRLVRRLCQHCKRPSARSNWPAVSAAAAAAGGAFEAVGCDRCQGIGYRGRFAIFETLIVTSGIERAIAEGAGEAEIEEMARREGMESLRDDGLRRVLAGETSAEELAQVTQLA